MLEEYGMGQIDDTEKANTKKLTLFYSVIKTSD